ncbi:transmembrane protein 209 [Juglans microcarpa x Juglans regia]|uniref:transmembrane protein 209 n=1 Tax=Juglans microcarpa x Juglans regia TaxID=2249226 RepID=UPI001B7F0B12|nr:transmembrane protein 209 [Juglans microcarpa x Juglans regia]
MESGATRDKGSSPPPKPSKFSVYQNEALSSALTAKSLRPSNYSLLCIFTFSSASAFALLTVISRENGFIDSLKFKNIPQEVAYLFAKAIQTVVGLVFFGTIFALVKAISLRRARNTANVPVLSSSKGNKDQTHLTKHQLGLLGIKSKVEQVVSETSKKPPKSRPHLTPSSDILVPLHQPMISPNRSSRTITDRSNSSGGNRMRSVGTPSKSPSSSSSLYLVPGGVSQLSSVQNSPGLDSLVSTPWSNKRASSGKEITSEEKLEKFLAEIEEKITESAGKLSTPPPTISGFRIASPNTVSSSANTSGATRSTPLRPVRMSPGSQKFSTSPKKGEGDLPPPMSLEESIEAFQHLGIYPHIEQWRDHLRQWFSSVLINPLLKKIETSHLQVMQAAARIGISMTISQVGSDLPTAGIPATMFPIDRTKDWQPAFTLDEDGVLHQLRATLVQAIDASLLKLPLPNLQQPPQQNPLIPAMQQCVDAITEYQKLHALMKGELVKGLLPQSSIQADYIVQRIQELAEGTCLKSYEYLGSGEVYDKKNKKWTLELPTDSHLLLYLFCAFLEHPKWMLHVDPTSHSGVQSIKDPLFLGVLPPKERFPEKYVAVISGVPSVLHPGASVLVVGRQSPPIFALYWDKKLQFSLQGRTALWDSILLFCHRIKVGHGGIVRGIHLGSSALSILPVLDLETED